MTRRSGWLIAAVAILLSVATPASAQWLPHRFGRPETRQAARPARPLNERLRLPAASSPNRLRRALIGGVIGSAAGVVTCTAISNLVKDRGTGFSTCTTSGYTGFIVGGFAVGALIGAITR